MQINKFEAVILESWRVSLVKWDVCVCVCVFVFVFVCMYVWVLLTASRAVTCLALEHDHPWRPVHTAWWTEICVESLV